MWRVLAAGAAAAAAALAAGWPLSPRVVARTPAMVLALLHENPAGEGAATAEAVAAGVDLSGQVAVITGGCGGIGSEMARVLSLRGAEVVVGCRADACERLESGRCVPLDVSELGSVRRFAEEFIATGLPLHMLILNAAVMAPPGRSTSADGVELQFATNYLGHWQLVQLLSRRLQSTAGARLVAVSSVAHVLAGRFDPATLADPPTYDPEFAYGATKACMVLLVAEVRKRLGVTARAAHPGVALTGLLRHSWKMQLFYKALLPVLELLAGRRLLKTVPEAAATPVWCAVTDDAPGGPYYSDLSGEEDSSRMLPDVLYDAGLASQLWSHTERLVEGVGAG
eukprot:TRINITY_DN40045_c0_g1_i1.p1 TRINITY_DN40045_c0_g1~~TRINITY_DN40045_c0_g1_i1.p1  ORF type:complete len:340 (+),score=102.46 TRINITY_DN40045_c0_g1_i1:57-1076(+)